MAINGGSIAAGFAAGAAPGIQAIGQKYKQSKKDQATANAMLPGTNAQVAAGLSSPSMDPTKAIGTMSEDDIRGGHLDMNSALDNADQNRSNVLAADHPAWGIMANMTGNPGNAPLPGGGAPSPISTDNNGNVNAPISVAQQQGMTGGGDVQTLQNGGVVRANYGRKTIAPSFERGPVLPTGPNNTITGPTSAPAQGMAGYEGGGVVNMNDATMATQATRAQRPTGATRPQRPQAMTRPTLPNGQAYVPVDGFAEGGPVGDTAMGQGITPASPEGIQGFDGGGVVPEGFMAPAGNINVPMTGAAAGLVQGIQAGQSIGHNLKQQWDENHLRSANANYAGALTGVDVNNPNSGSTPTDTDEGILGKARDAVEGFFHHMNSVSLDDNHKANGKGVLPVTGDNAAPSGAGGGSPIPSDQSANASPGAGAPVGGAPAPAAPASAPSPVPSAGAPAPAAPQQGGGPAQPAQPSATGGTSVNPEDPQGMRDQQQATQVAVKSVAGDANVRTGTPDKSPEASQLPHSMTPDQWNHLNTLKQQAVMAAAKAGEDPAKVYESLTAMQNAHFQGQILKQLGTANVAFQNGDMKSVEQALKNVNYYLPNGQDIQFKKATSVDVAADPSVKPGDLMYKNPFYGMYGHEKDPEYTKVDSQHIQSLGAAALDPRTVQEAQLKSYSAQQSAQSERIKAQGEFMTGQGRQLTGSAAYQKAGLAAQGFAVDQRLKTAAGNKDQAEANWYNTRQPSGNTGQPKITMPSLRAAQNDAITYADRIVQGQPTSSPVMVKDPTTGQMEPNLSPGAGKSIPDPSRIPQWAQHVTPEQQESAKVLGAQIASANLGLPGMNTSKAVELGFRMTHELASPGTHLNPQTHRPEKNLVYDGQAGTAHIWMGNAWENVYLKPNVADESGTGGALEVPPPGGNSAPSNGGGENEGPDAFQ